MEEVIEQPLGSSAGARRQAMQTPEEVQAMLKLAAGINEHRHPFGVRSRAQLRDQVDDAGGVARDADRRVARPLARQRSEGGTPLTDTVDT